MRRNRIMAVTGAVAGIVMVAAGALTVWYYTNEADAFAKDPEVSAESSAEVTSAATTTIQTKPSASLADPDMTAVSNTEEVKVSDEVLSDSTTATVSDKTDESVQDTTAAETTATEQTTTGTTAEQTTTTKAPAKSGTLDSISDLPAGKVISSEKIDTSDLGKYFTSHKISKDGAVFERINGKSYRKNDNISLSDLRYLKMLHVNFNGEYQVGEMIVNKSVAGDVLEIFKSLCKKKYQIYSMYLIDNFWAGSGSKSDSASIDANNTSAFCYRSASDSGNLSKHALGLAIDINPQQNPYVTYKDGKPKFSHDNAADYVENRSSDTPHVITKKDSAYKLFRDYGWTWGGSWSSPKDYQHFQFG